MIVKNIECQNAEFIEMIIKELTENNINYLLIGNEGYMELHFDNYIYNFFCLECSTKKENLSSFIDYSAFLTRPKQKNKKIQPGLKKYNKGLIKNDNFKNKIGRR